MCPHTHTVGGAPCPLLGARSFLGGAHVRFCDVLLRIASSSKRTNPAFKVGESPLSVQTFSNPVTNVPNPRPDDEYGLQQAASELPTHVCAVSTRDGYKPSATLFVDEDWISLRSARESSLGALMFRPVVR